MNEYIHRVRRVSWGCGATLVLVLGLPVAMVLQGLDVPTHWEMLHNSMLATRHVLRWLHLISLGVSAVALLALIVRSRRGVGWLLAMRGWRPAFLWLLSLCAAIGLTSLAYAWVVYGEVAMTNLAFDSLLLLLWSLWVLGLVAASFCVPTATARQKLRLWEKTAALVLCLLLVVEAACTMVDANVFTMAFVYNTEDQREFSMYREALRGELFGYPFNSQGYYDKEFVPKEPGSCVVSFIADSFGLGVVPYPWNVVTVVEDHLRQAWQGACNQTEVLNFSVPQMGMKGYIQVAQHEAPAYKPDFTVLSVYTCNDITVVDANMDNHGYVQNWRLMQFFLRKLRPYARPEPFYRLPFKRDPSLPKRIDDMLDNPPPPPPHILDASLEHPSFPKDLYQIRLGNRLRYLEPDKPSMQTQYRMFFQSLDHFRKVVNTPMLLVVTPDELQVDDAVWASLMVGRDPSKYVRDLPQQRILEYCRNTGLPVVDLLPALREAQQTQGRVYHLQDTHWNALGNKVAAEAVAKAILETYSPAQAAASARVEGASVGK